MWIVFVSNLAIKNRGYYLFHGRYIAPRTVPHQRLSERSRRYDRNGTIRSLPDAL